MPKDHAGRQRMAWDDTLADIRTGNSRIAAILAGSLVQMVLKVAVTYNMVPLTKAEDKNLFEGSGPLSTLSAQINVGYALGLFGKKVRHDLNVIRDIRNDFAHTLHVVTLEHADFAGRLAALDSVQLLPDKSDKPPADLLASAAELLCLFLIMRTAPPLKGADKELLENLNDLEFSNFPPLKRRDYPAKAS